MVSSASEELPLREQAYLHIKKLILDEQAPANSFLSERSLAEQLGMSKTPIRLAIARLENEGYVRVSPQQGIVVLALSFEDILDYIDYRLALETYIVKNITGSLTSSQVQAMHSILREQAKIVKDKNSTREELVYADTGFHKFLASLKGNRQISQALERQQEMLFRIASRIFQQYPGRREQSFAEHQTLVGYIVEGKKDEAIELIERHILRIKSLLIGTDSP